MTPDNNELDVYPLEFNSLAGELAYSRAKIACLEGILFDLGFCTDSVYNRERHSVEVWTYRAPSNEDEDGEEWKN